MKTGKLKVWYAKFWQGLNRHERIAIVVAGIFIAIALIYPLVK